MPNRRRTIEIWDNYWKELPALVYLTFMLSIAAQIILVFTGGMLFFKANWIFSILTAVVTGLMVYVISYKMIQAKADIQHSKGFQISFLLVIPYASTIFFGGLSASNHWGYHEIQKAEFEWVSQNISAYIDEIEGAFTESKEHVTRELIDQCHSCSSLATESKRQDAARELEECIGNGKALACVDRDSSVDSDLSNWADREIGDSSGDLSELNELLEQVRNGGIMVQIQQYKIQSGLSQSDSLLKAASRELAQSTLAFSNCIPALFPFPTEFNNVPKQEEDCSDPGKVFCAGWGLKPAILLLVVILGSLLAPLFTEGWSEGDISSSIGVDDSFTQGL